MYKGHWDAVILIFIPVFSTLRYCELCKHQFEFAPSEWEGLVGVASFPPMHAHTCKCTHCVRVDCCVLVHACTHTHT